MRLLITTAAILFGATALRANEVDYARDIKPLLKNKCFACHGPLKQNSLLRLDSGASILRGGKGGSVVKPGDPVKSLLIQVVTSMTNRMPPEGKPLDDKQIALLKTWIAQGAKFPADDKPEEDPAKHWAFQRPVQADVANRNPVDHFLAAEWSKVNIQPLGAAEKNVLLRRLYIDLIGLPPTRDELQAFLNDASPNAYEKVVDKLLASPQYGERWARHWMDVWRYSDWYGRRAVPDVMNSYARIFRWRDWIVRSLNDDKGYDRMVMEMLAADEICPEEHENVVATGFLVRNWFKWNYHQWMKDNVEHTAKAFLGLTLNCCHCHDHKYDPIKHEEYFAFRAFFEPMELRHDRWPGEIDPGPFKKYVYAQSYGPMQGGIIRVFDEKLDAKTQMYSGGEERNVIEGKPPIAPAAPAFLGGDKLKIETVSLPAGAWNPASKAFVVQEEITRRSSLINGVNASQSLANLPAVFAPLGPQYPKASTGRRTALAKWIASADNPLTARVAVNHIWNWHFGRPLVESTFDFGRNGKRPTHPELLNYLAVELTKSGWKMKSIHRLILTSNAYRMSSNPNSAVSNQQSADSDNRLYWRFPTQRMEAEVVRDSLLYLAGELDKTIGGVEIPHEQGLTSKRRSIYFAHHGESRMEFLDIFDAANPCDCYKRSSSVLPQQALALSNNELTLRLGRVLASKLAMTDEPAFIRAAFEQMLCRAPGELETKASVAFLVRQRELTKGIPAAKGVWPEVPSTDPTIRARENLIIALFNHNDFVTIR